MQAVDSATVTPVNTRFTALVTDATMFQAGDLVLLGVGAPVEFRGSKAVVTKIAQDHCTVAVLDSSLRFSVGECWPMLHDMRMLSHAWRLGTRVVIDGLKTGKLKGFNGSVCKIEAHPSQGHPFFVCKPGRESSAQAVRFRHNMMPQLAMCLRFDDVKSAGSNTVILEPRFLKTNDNYAEVLLELSNLPELHLHTAAA